MERNRYGEGPERELRPTSFFIRRLAEPNPKDPTRRLYETERSLIADLVKNMPDLSPDKLRTTINLSRYNFAKRVLLPEEMPADVAEEHKKDMEYIRSRYPDIVLSDMDVLQMVERSDGTKTNYALIKSRTKREEVQPQESTVPEKADLSNWNEQFGHDWFLDLQKKFKGPEPSPYMGERGTEVKVPSDLDRPLPDHNSVIFLDNG